MEIFHAYYLCNPLVRDQLKGPLLPDYDNFTHQPQDKSII